MSFDNYGDNTADILELEALMANPKRLPWTCNKCDEPAPLVMVQEDNGPKFRSACHTAPVRPTRER